MGFHIFVVRGWAYNRAGNLLFKSADRIWNSNAAKIVRLSIINKTYAFCDKVRCSHIKEELKIDDSRFDDLYCSDNPSEVYVSIDKSCNLHCKSCRNNQFTAKGISAIKPRLLARKLIKSNWTRKSERLILAGQGEVFFSKIYKNMLYESEITKRDSIEILTNGTLMTKDNLDRLCTTYNNVKFYITVDAATEETYKKLRAGGNFNFLMKNLEYLSTLRKQNKVSRVELHFVVQKGNYKEMVDFVKLNNKLHFDKVHFMQIANWGTYTDKEFAEVSMIQKNGMPKKELAAVLKHPLIKESLYEYSNISKFIKN